MARVELINVTKTFGAVTAVDDVSLDVPDGSFTVLLGPSGCGKTTTLQMLAGLESVTAGEVRFDGQPITHVPPHKRDVAVVFQSYALYPQKTVFGNMAFGLRARRTPKAETTRRVQDAAALLGIERLLERRPGTLSGGQRQRVALGRAIVRRPRLFLLDEPLSNVDAKLRADMRVELRLLQQRLGATFVYVTHDQLEAMTMADLVAVMDQGRLLQVGSPDTVYSEPGSLGVAKFIGNPPMNLVPGRFVGDDESATAVAGPWRVPVRGHGEAQGECVIGVHFEDLLLVSPGEVDGEIVAVEHLGAERRVVVRTRIGDLGVRVERSASVAVGTRVGVRAVPGALHVFDSATGARAELRGLHTAAAPGPSAAPAV